MEKRTDKEYIFYAFFLLSLWLNLPCFVNVSNLENVNNLIAFPFKAYSKSDQITNLKGQIKTNQKGYVYFENKEKI